MSDLQQLTVYQWFTTPSQLRNIADKMEHEIARRIPGDDVPSHMIYGEGNVRLQIMLNQERFHKERR
jgi:hypothetical protein